MKHIKKFHLFESLLSEFPKNNKDLENYLETESGKDLKSMMEILYSQKYRKIGYGIEINKAGSIVFYGVSTYDITVSKIGNISYGSMRVNPHYIPTNESISYLFDFVSIYLFSIVNGFKFDVIEKFVYTGSPLSTSVYSRLKNNEAFNILIRIAKRHNGDEKIESSINSSNSPYIDINEEFVKNCKAYKFYNEIFNFKIEKKGQYNGEYILIRGYGTPFDIFKKSDGRLSTKQIELSFFVTGKIYKTAKAAEAYVNKEIISYFKEFPKPFNYYDQLSEDETKTFMFIMDNVQDFYEKIDSFPSDLLDKIMDHLLYMNPFYFSRIIKSLENSDNPEFIRIVKKYKDTSGDILKGAEVFDRFGILGDDYEEDPGY